MYINQDSSSSSSKVSSAAEARTTSGTFVQFNHRWRHTQTLHLGPAFTGGDHNIQLNHAADTWHV